MPNIQDRSIKLLIQQNMKKKCFIPPVLHKFLQITCQNSRCLNINILPLKTI